MTNALCYPPISFRSSSLSNAPFADRAVFTLQFDGKNYTGFVRENRRIVNVPKNDILGLPSCQVEEKLRRFFEGCFATLNPLANGSYKVYLRQRAVGGVQIEAEQVISPQESLFELDVKATRDGIGKLLNREILASGAVKKEIPLSKINGKLDLEISRLGDFSSKFIDNAIVTEVKVGLKLAWALKIKGFNISDQVGFEFLLKTWIRNLSIKEDYQVDMTVEVSIEDLYVQIPEQAKKIAGKEITDFIQKELQEQSNKIPQLINEEVGIKPKIHKFWNEAARGIQLPHELTLAVKPLSCHMMPLKIESESLTFSIGIKAHLGVFSGSILPLKNVLPMPNLDIRSVCSGSCHIPLKSLIDFGRINKEIEAHIPKINEELTKNPISLPGKVVTYTIQAMNASLSQSENGKLDLKVKIKGDIEGQITFTGKICYNKEKNQFSVDNFDYLLNSSSIVINFMDSILHRSISTALSKKLTFSMQGPMSEGKEALQSQLDNKLPQGDISLKIHLNDLDCTELSNSSTGPIVSVDFKGTARASLS